MTNFGVVIKIDPVGRCVIPKSVRDTFHISGHATLEVLVTDQGVLLRKPTYEVVKKQ